MNMKYSFVAAALFGSALAWAQPDLRHPPQGQEVAAQPQIILLKKSGDVQPGVASQGAVNGTGTRLPPPPARSSSGSARCGHAAR